MPSTITVERPLLSTSADFIGDLGVNPIQNIGNDFYLPLTVRVTKTPKSVAVVAPVVTSGTLTASVTRGFDDVKVGDIITGLTAGTISPRATGIINDAYLPQSLSHILYNSTYTSSTLPVKAGDTVTVVGNGIPVGTKVIKIDYTNRQIFLSAAPTISAIDDVTVTQPIRVTAVRRSTSTLNPNQIDFDSTIATTLGATTVNIIGAAIDAVLTVFKFTPVNNPTNSQARFNVSYATLDGTLASGTPSGLNNIPNLSLLLYTSMGIYNTDLDKFLLNADLDSPIS